MNLLRMLFIAGCRAGFKLGNPVPVRETVKTGSPGHVCYMNSWVLIDSTSKKQIKSGDQDLVTVPAPATLL